MGRVYLILTRLSVILFFIGHTARCQNGQGSQNNILGNNTPFGNVNFNNGYVIVNGTKRFGPDMGVNYFQQALNSLAQPANQFSGGGGDIAVYGFNFVPQCLQLTNKYNGSWKIHGSGVISSGIIGPAPLINCNSFGGGYVDNDSQGRFVTEISDLTIAGVTNAVTNIIQLHNNGKSYIHDNWIGCWTYMTNHFVAGTSPGFFLPFSGPTSLECDLVGISMFANFVDYQYVEHNSFLLLACALDIQSYDHVRFENNFLSQVGAVFDNTAAIQLSPNLWPATQPESIGCAVIVRNGIAQNNGDFKARNNYFYIGGFCYMFLNQGNVSPQIFRNSILEDDMTENSGGYILTDGYARTQVLNCPASKTSIGQNPFAALVGAADCGIVSTNQFFITQTNWITNFPPVKIISLNNTPPQLSEGLIVAGGAVSVVSPYGNSSLSNSAWISSPITLYGGVDPAMNGVWSFKGFDATLGVHTWTNPPNANYILWANTNATTYNPGTPGLLNQLILSTNTVSETFTNIGNWITTYTFSDTLGYCNQRYYNGFTNWVQVAYNTLGGTLNTPPFAAPFTWTNGIVSGYSTVSTNTLAVSATGVTNNGSINYLLTITAGTGLALKDANGNQFATPVLGDTVPLKPGWRFTGTGVTAQAFAQ